MQGRLITLEGIDGVGKTTHSRLIAEFLRSHDLEVTEVRDPGCTALGEELRTLLKAGLAQSATAELMLFAAARSELVQQRLRPELELGRYVVLDRFTDSTLAYQGALEQVPDSVLVAVCLAAADRLFPDVTFWLDLNPEEAFSRCCHPAEAIGLAGGEETGTSRELDAIERRSTEYFTKVRERYLAIHHSDPQRVVQIDAGGSVEETSMQIIAELNQRLENWRNG